MVSGDIVGGRDLRQLFRQRDHHVHLVLLVNQIAGDGDQIGLQVGYFFQQPFVVRPEFLPM